MAPGVTRTFSDNAFGQVSNEDVSSLKTLAGPGEDTCSVLFSSRGWQLCPHGQLGEHALPHHASFSYLYPVFGTALQNCLSWKTGSPGTFVETLYQDLACDDPLSFCTETRVVRKEGEP